MDPSKFNIEKYIETISNAGDLNEEDIEEIGRLESSGLYSLFVGRINPEKTENHYLKKGYQVITSINRDRVKARLARDGLDLKSDAWEYATAQGIVPRGRLIDNVSTVARQVKEAVSFFNLVKQQTILKKIKNDPNHWIRSFVSSKDLAVILDLSQPIDQHDFDKEKALAEAVINLCNYEREITEKLPSKAIPDFQNRLKNEIQEKVKETPLEKIKVDEIKQKLQESGAKAKEEELAKVCGKIFAAKAPEYFKEQNILVTGNPEDLPAFKAWQKDFDLYIKPLQSAFEDWGLQEQFIKIANDYFEDVSFSTPGSLKSAFLGFAKTYNERGAELQNFENEIKSHPIAKVLLAEEFKKAELTQGLRFIAPSNFQEDYEKKIVKPLEALRVEFLKQGVDPGTFNRELHAELKDFKDGTPEGIQKSEANLKKRLDTIVADYDAKPVARQPFDSGAIPESDLEVFYQKSFQEYLELVRGEVGGELASRFEETLSSQQKNIADVNFAKIIAYKKLEAVRETLVDRYVNHTSYSKIKIRDCIDEFFQKKESLPQDPEKLFDYLTNDTFLKEFESFLDETSGLNKFSYAKLWAMYKGWDFTGESSQASSAAAIQKASESTPVKESQSEKFIGNKRNATEFLQYMKKTEGYSDDSRKQFGKAINEGHRVDMDYYSTAYDEKSLFRAVGTAFLLTLAQGPVQGRKMFIEKHFKPLNGYFTSSNDPKDKEVYDNFMKIVQNESLINPTEVLKTIQENSETISQFFQTVTANAMKLHTSTDKELKALYNVTPEQMEQFINGVKLGLSNKEALFLDPEVLILVLEEILNLKIRNYDLEDTQSGYPNLKNDQSAVFLMHSLFTPKEGTRIDHFDVMIPVMNAPTLPQQKARASAAASQPASAAMAPLPSAAKPPKPTSKIEDFILVDEVGSPSVEPRDLLGKKMNAAAFANFFEEREQVLRDEVVYNEWMLRQHADRITSLMDQGRNLLEVAKNEGKALPKSAPSAVEKGVELLKRNGEAIKLDYFPIAPDGHCLFRSVGMALVMNYLQGSSAYKTDLRNKLKGLSPIFVTAIEKQAFKEFTDLMAHITRIKDPAERLEAIRNPANSNVLVKFLRHLAVRMLKNDPRLSQTIEAESGKTPEAYYEEMLRSSYGGHREIVALFKTLGFALNVIDLKIIGQRVERPITNVKDLLTATDTNNGEFGDIYLIFNPAVKGPHYDFALPATS